MATGTPGAGDACFAAALREALSPGAGGEERAENDDDDDELPKILSSSPSSSPPPPRPPPPQEPQPLQSCDRLDHGSRVRLSLALLGCQAAALGERLPACVSDAAVLSGAPSRSGGGGGGLSWKRNKRRSSSKNEGGASSSSSTSSSMSNVAAGACARSLDDRHYATFNEFFVHVGT